MMKLHDLPICKSLEVGMAVLETLIREKYSTYSVYERDLDRAIENAAPSDKEGSGCFKGFTPN